MAVIALAVPSTQVRDDGFSGQAVVVVGEDVVIERRWFVCGEGVETCRVTGFDRSQASGVAHGGVGRVLVGADLDPVDATWVLFVDVGLDGLARVAQRSFELTTMESLE
jgi:hypothetical protein